MLEQPKIDLLSAVSEIHDNLKENTATALTEEETEDEFHEEMQGGPLLLLLLLHLLAWDLEMRPAATNPDTNDHTTDPASHLAPPALEYQSDIIACIISTYTISYHKYIKYMYKNNNLQREITISGQF